MKYARMFGNVAGEIFTPPENVSITECFTPEVVALFTAVPDDVEVGWRKQPDGSFVARPEPAPEPEPDPAQVP
jgi:hypothetical protein